MKPEPSLTVISLGGGVQSSVMALMANEGAFDRIPDCAIFADTRWEPPSIYEHLTWLKDRLSFPLYVVDNGRSLREDVKALTNHSGSRNYVDIPVYLKGRDGEGDGIGRRQCTDNYKIRPSAEGFGRCWDSGPGNASPPEPPSSCGSASPPTRPYASRIPGTVG